jgi:glycerol-3-phosphate O-acyltransferase
MSNLSLQKGVNSLFFPGGTRSREGSLETSLKMGLLNSVVEAQRNIYENEGRRKIVIVPLILSYHFVLEAKFLINQYLLKKGQERFIEDRDQSLSIRNVLKFAWKFFSESSEIVLSFGTPMDVLGNNVDRSGISYDERGKPLDIKEYFFQNKNISKDRQREQVYTRRLANKIIASYYQNNVVLSSHLVAFCGFEILKKINPNQDIFNLIRLPEDEFTFSKSLFKHVMSQVLDKIRELEKMSQIILADNLKELTPDELIIDGIKNLGIYQSKQPLKITKKGEVVSESFKLLYYYHNRLSNYELDRFINWEESLIKNPAEAYK